MLLLSPKPKSAARWREPHPKIDYIPKMGSVYVTLQATVRQIPQQIPSGHQITGDGVLLSSDWNLEECSGCNFRVSKVKDGPCGICQGICLAGACSVMNLVKLQGVSQTEPDS